MESGPHLQACESRTLLCCIGGPRGRIVVPVNDEHWKVNVEIRVFKIDARVLEDRPIRLDL